MKEIKKQFARTLRKDQTEAESIAWDQLRNKKCFGLKFRRQHVFEGFVLDFYCHQHRIGIELDGGIHRKQKDYDEVRQDLIQSKGITIIRINNDELEKDDKIIQERIKEALNPIA